MHIASFYGRLHTVAIRFSDARLIVLLDEWHRFVAMPHPRHFLCSVTVGAANGIAKIRVALLDLSIAIRRLSLDFAIGRLARVNVFGVIARSRTRHLPRCILTCVRAWVTLCIIGVNLCRPQGITSLLESTTVFWKGISLKTLDGAQLLFSAR